MSSSVYAGVPNCVGEGTQYPNLNINDGGGVYPVKCQTTITEDGQTFSIYAKSSGDCASAGTLATSPETCYEEERFSNSSNNEKDNNENGLSVIDLVLMCALCVSVTLNAVFVVLLSKKTKKIVVVANNPTSAAHGNSVADVYPTPNNN